MNTELRAKIDQWFSDSFKGGAVRLQTNAYNQVTEAVAKLKDILDPPSAELAAKPATIAPLAAKTD